MPGSPGTGASMTRIRSRVSLFLSQAEYALSPRAVTTENRKPSPPRILARQDHGIGDVSTECNADAAISDGLQFDQWFTQRRDAVIRARGRNVSCRHVDNDTIFKAWIDRRAVGSASDDGTHHHRLTAESLRERPRQRAAPDQKTSAIDFEPVVKLFTPDGNATWLLTELDPNREYLAFGLCDLGLGEPELGYVSVYELAAARGLLGLPLKQNLYFAPTRTIVAYAELAREHRRIIT